MKAYKLKCYNLLSDCKTQATKLVTLAANLVSKMFCYLSQS